MTSRWDDDFLRDPNLTPEQVEYLDRRAAAFREYYRTGDPEPLREFGLDLPDKRSSTQLPEQVQAATNGAINMDALRTFIDDNEDLGRLEAILDRFNIFEALGIVRRENRHSDFIRWLLDPSETHGLGDYWLRQFLRQVIKAGEGISDDFLTLFDLDAPNFGQAEVRREWRNIDLLILDQEHRFVCAIENKVDSGEGSCQLQRYREIVEREFVGYKKSFVFLTIAGDAPSDGAYIPMSYGDLVSTVETALQRRQTQLNDEIRLFVQQYLDMVRRHIVEDSDIQELCRRLYRNHQRALDLIFQHRPDRAGEVAQAIEKYVKSREDWIPGYLGKTYLKFLPVCMDALPRKGQAENNGLLLSCWLQNKDERIRFKLEMGPGPQEIRERVFEKAKSHPRAFGSPKAKLYPVWHSFGGSEVWITPNEYNDLNDEEIGQRIGEKIEVFLEQKGHAIADALRELKFAEISEE